MYRFFLFLWIDCCDYLSHSRAARAADRRYKSDSAFLSMSMNEECGTVAVVGSAIDRYIHAHTHLTEEENQRSEERACSHHFN